MTETLQKTLSSLSSVIAGEPQGPTRSRAFINFVTSFGALRSKYEEEQLIHRELNLQKQKLRQPGLSLASIRESLVRLIYCHMLGYNVDFAHIYAVKLAQQGTLLDKRVGYLVCSLFLSDNEEFLILVVNTIQKDLQSTNVLDVCMGLTVLTYLVTPEMIPSVLPLVEQKLSHPKETLRKKAVTCIHHFFRKAPELMQPLQGHLRQALCDKDPSVVWAALHFFTDKAKREEKLEEDIVGSLVGILQQIVTHRLPAEYDFHSVPAPWLQIQLLQTLALCCSASSPHCQALQEVLSDILQRTDPSHKIGLAVVYECLQTISAVHPGSQLFEHAAKCVGKFVTAKSNNLRYLGLKALTSLVEINPRYALEHQKAIIACLEDTDQTIQVKTLGLLEKICNHHNMDVIITKMLEHIVRSQDGAVRLLLGMRAASLVQQYSQDVKAYLTSMNKICRSIGKENIPNELTEQILQYVHANTKRNSETAEWVVSYSMEMLQDSSTPKALVTVAIWCLGEYVTDNMATVPRQAINQLLSTFSGSHVAKLQKGVLSALVKLVNHIQHPSTVVEVLETGLVHGDYGAALQLSELKGLLLNQPLKESFQRELDCSDMDFFLSFLDQYVCEALEAGALPYRPRSLRLLPKDTPEEGVSTFLSAAGFMAFDSPAGTTAPSSDGAVSGNQVNVTGVAETKASSGSQEYSRDSSSILKKRDVKQVWSTKGLLKEPSDRESPTSPSQLEPAASQHDESKGHERSTESSAKYNHKEAAHRAQEEEKRQALAAALFSNIDVQAVVPKASSSHTTSLLEYSEDSITAMSDTLGDMYMTEGISMYDGQSAWPSSSMYGDVDTYSENFQEDTVRSESIEGAQSNMGTGSMYSSLTDQVQLQSKLSSNLENPALIDAEINIDNSQAVEKGKNKQMVETDPASECELEGYVTVNKMIKKDSDV